MRIKCPHCNGKGFSEINSAVNMTCGWCMGQGELDLEIVPTEQTTNEDFLRTATTEQLAEWFTKSGYLACVQRDCTNCKYYDKKNDDCDVYEFIDYEQMWVEWLKQPHTNKGVAE